MKECVKIDNFLGKKNEGTQNQRENQDYTDQSIIDIGENTQKSPGDLRRHLKNIN